MLFLYWPNTILPYKMAAVEQETYGNKLAPHVVYMWLQITDQRGEFSGELVSIADIVYFSAAYKPVQCTQTANGFVLVPKSSHSIFASSRICGYSSVGRYVGSPFHLRFHIFFHLPCGVRTGIHSRSIV